VRQATVLSLKLAVYVLIFGVTMPVLGWLRLPQSMILAAVHTLLLWLADLIVLPRFGNAVATAGDMLVLVVGSFLVLGAMMALPNPMGLLAAVALGTLFEFGFHRWLVSHSVLR
jgi:hypothetical protein